MAKKSDVLDIANYIWCNKRKISFPFDYPRFGNLPDILIKKLSSDIIFAIQTSKPLNLCKDCHEYSSAILENIEDLY